MVSKCPNVHKEKWTNGQMDMFENGVWVRGDVTVWLG